ncbi:hypothetical protein I317_03354 [Kwoniella heveanensis CBS 569]|uniref:DUF833-domain-containing protein n=1 Tax=Kwoniella heveanensis BCC8398 TaxID=1296120 RepID=A0A1B9GLA1_9TREE|nr:hypothetical protein I316_06448 [Kwoniella heveanensis BCC8398]OCF42877.1 hypothetical protein I317_03354 [Kwoniella heveanensis CBS 569]
MCISFFTLSQPGYKLILASNRDEFLARPTLPAAWHTFSFSSASPATPVDGHDESETQGWVLSGLDRGKAEGGTWLGITRDHRVGLLTNVRLTPPTPPVAPSPNPPSRGLLLKDFLSPPPPPFASASPSSSSTSLPSVHEYLSSHYESAGEYEGFNLLLFSLGGDKAEVGYLTNRPVPCGTTALDTSSLDEKHRIPAECFGISNSPMSEPWPKVQQGEKRMVDTLLAWEEKGEGDEELVERMFALLGQSCAIKSEEDMKSSTTIPLIKLPARAVTTLPTASADAAKPRYYGTRTSTIIIIKDSGETMFVERDILWLDESGEPAGMFEGDDGERPKDRCFEFTACTAAE